MINFDNLLEKFYLSYQISKNILYVKLCTCKIFYFYTDKELEKAKKGHNEKDGYFKIKEKRLVRHKVEETYKNHDGCI